MSAWSKFGQRLMEWKISLSWLRGIGTSMTAVTIILYVFYVNLVEEREFWDCYMPRSVGPASGEIKVHLILFVPILLYQLLSQNGVLYKILNAILIPFVTYSLFINIDNVLIDHIRREGVWKSGRLSCEMLWGEFFPESEDWSALAFIIILSVPITIVLIVSLLIRFLNMVAGHRKMLSD